MLDDIDASRRRRGSTADDAFGEGDGGGGGSSLGAAKDRQREPARRHSRDARPDDPAARVLDGIAAERARKTGEVAPPAGASRGNSIPRGGGRGRGASGPKAAAAPAPAVAHVSSSPVASDGTQLIVPDAVDQGETFSVVLPTTLSGLGTITGWRIDWGDGSDPDGDGAAGQWLPGNPPTVDHVYTADPGTYTVQVTASDGTSEVEPDAASIVVRPALVISGPDSANEGDALSYTVRGPAADDALWWVTKDGQPFTTGQGSALSFQAGGPGTYVVQAEARDGAEAPVLSASLTVPVANVAPKVTIAGPIFAYYGRPAAFSAAVTEPGAGDPPLRYLWQIGDATGRVITTETGVPRYPTATTSTYLTPPELPATLPDGYASPYAVVLTVDDGEGGVTTQTKPFQVVPDPGASEYANAVVPVIAGPGYNLGTDDRPYAVAVQADGKLIVGGTGIRIDTRNDLGQEKGAFLARYNRDLTLDTSFGVNGIVFDALTPFDYGYQRSEVTAIAFDPVTQDVVVTGSLRTVWTDINTEQIAVARYTADGVPDRTFGVGGSGWTLVRPKWGPDGSGLWPGTVGGDMSWVGTPLDVVVLPDRSILVGGSQTAKWTTEGNHPHWGRTSCWPISRPTGHRTSRSGGAGSPGR